MKNKPVANSFMILKDAFFCKFATFCGDSRS